MNMFNKMTMTNEIAVQHTACKWIFPNILGYLDLVIILNIRLPWKLSAVLSDREPEPEVSDSSWDESDIGSTVCTIVSLKTHSLVICKSTWLKIRNKELFWNTGFMMHKD